MRLQTNRTNFRLRFKLILINYFKIFPCTRPLTWLTFRFWRSKNLDLTAALLTANNFLTVPMVRKIKFIRKTPSITYLSPYSVKLGFSFSPSVLFLSSESCSASESLSFFFFFPLSFFTRVSSPLYSYYEKYIIIVATTQITLTVYSGQKEARKPTSSVKFGRIHKWCFPIVHTQIRQKIIRRITAKMIIVTRKPAAATLR